MNLYSFLDNCKNSYKIRTKQSRRIHYLNKNTLEKIKSRLDNIEEQISEFRRYCSGNHPSLTEKREKNKKEISLRNIWDNIKHQFHIIEILEERDKGEKNIFEDILSENFPNLGKKTGIQVKESQRSSSKMNPKRCTPTYIIITIAN